MQFKRPGIECCQPREGHRAFWNVGESVCVLGICGPLLNSLAGEFLPGGKQFCFEMALIGHGCAPQAIYDGRE